MIKIKNADVYGFEGAIRGMRNPMNSWDKSDTKHFDKCGVFKVPQVGSDDLKLMKALAKAGSDHGKFLRFINVTLDITAPLYWWKEFDTYKVGTVANSCSTMHCVHKKEFTSYDFSTEHLHDVWLNDFYCLLWSLNHAREKFLETKDNDYWWQMIQLLPSSYNQKRTVQLNYQVLKAMYHARKSHKLDEWREFCKWCESLPYFKELCINE